MVRRKARSPVRSTSGRSRATIRKPCAVQGPIPGTWVRAWTTSSSVMATRAWWLSRPSTKRSARARSVAPLRVDIPLARSTWGSAARSSWGEGRWPPKCSCTRDRIVRVAVTDSCWPMTWKTSVPNASSGGSWSSQARGWKSGRPSMICFNTGSAFRRWSRACASTPVTSRHFGAWRPAPRPPPW